MTNTGKFVEHKTGTFLAQVRNKSNLPPKGRFFFKCCTHRSTALRLEYVQDLHLVNMAGDKQPAHVRKQRLSSAIFVSGRSRIWEHFR